MNLSQALRITLFFPFLVSSTFGAQDSETSRWLAAVRKATGQAVQIRLSGGNRIDGNLLRGDDSGLVVRHRRGETAVARSGVRQMRMRVGRSRHSGMLRGGLIGGAVGAGLATAGTLVARLGGGEGGNDGKLVAIGIGTVAAGVGIGVAIGSAVAGHYETIYEAP